MNSRDFLYWLQGYFELTSADAVTNVVLSNQHVDMIIRHHMLATNELAPDDALTIGTIGGILATWRNLDEEGKLVATNTIRELVQKRMTNVTSDMSSDLDKWSQLAGIVKPELHMSCGLTPKDSCLEEFEQPEPLPNGVRGSVFGGGGGQRFCSSPETSIYANPKGKGMLSC